MYNKQKVLRRMAALVVVLSVLLHGAVLASAADLSSPASHSTAAIRARGVLTIAVSMESKYNYLIPNDPETYGSLAGTRDGVVPELCRRIAKGNTRPRQNSCGRRRPERWTSPRTTSSSTRSGSPCTK